MITQMDGILILNAGPSCLHFWLYDASAVSLTLISAGSIRKLENTLSFQASDDRGLPVAQLSFDAPDPGFDHLAAVSHLTGWLLTQYGEHMALLGVGHRITHGGPRYLEPVLLNADVLADLEQIIELAPHDLPHNLAAARAVSRVRPVLPQVACFDTSFHRNRAPASERFALPASLLQGRLRRWGWQGLCYESVTARFVRLAPHVASGRVIVAHLGEHSGLSAVRAGRCVETTMGFSRLEGLPGATACGALDPAALLLLQRHLGPDELESILYSQSGLLGISGISGNLGVLLSSDDRRAAEAVDYFLYRVICGIGALAAALGGLDALIFTGDVGTAHPQLRARICRALSWVGIGIDPAANERRDQCISPPGRAPSVWVIPANQEGTIAAHTWRIVSKLPRLHYTRGGRDGRAVAQN
jgi:acetate kinase